MKVRIRLLIGVGILCLGMVIQKKSSSRTTIKEKIGDHYKVLLQKETTLLRNIAVGVDHLAQSTCLLLEECSHSNKQLSQYEDRLKKFEKELDNCIKIQQDMNAFLTRGIT